jgi:hypothetical protein
MNYSLFKQGENKMNPLEQISFYLNKINEITQKNNLGNIFYNEQYLELLIANILNHKYNSGQGCDAYDENGNPVEYKSINLNSKTIGSFQFHWLSKNKIDKYLTCKYFFFCIRKGVEILEIYKLKSDKILDILINKSKEKETYCTENKRKINAHKSFSLLKLKQMGAELVYSK